MPLFCFENNRENPIFCKISRISFYLMDVDTPKYACVCTLLFAVVCHLLSAFFKLIEWKSLNKSWRRRKLYDALALLHPTQKNRYLAHYYKTDALWKYNNLNKCYSLYFWMCCVHIELCVWWTFIIKYSRH